MLRLKASELEKHKVVEADDESGIVRTVAGCGRVFSSTEVAIVDPETRTRTPSPGGQVGEIWVADPAVAQGYWNRPEESGETFRATIAGTGEGPFLRTGDWGFLKDGQLFIAGRLKDVIIIRRGRTTTRRTSSGPSSRRTRPCGRRTEPRSRSWLTARRSWSSPRRSNASMPLA